MLANFFHFYGTAVLCGTRKTHVINCGRQILVLHLNSVSFSISCMAEHGFFFRHVTKPDSTYQLTFPVKSVDKSKK